MARLLVLDDQETVAYSTSVLLRRAGHHVDACSQLEKALLLAERNQYDVVISDLRLEKGSGLDVLNRVRERSLEAEVIIMTAYASIETAVDAMRRGAFDYISKPFHGEDLLEKVRKAVEKKTRSGDRVEFSDDKFPQCVSASPGFAQCLRRAQLLAGADCTVLLTGETGTGKSLLARVMHERSARASRPFIALNCANLSDQLLESELFGCAKGAFTGADASRPGLCEAAHKGTLFLDEIGATSVSVQSKLLTLLEDRLVRRLGETRSVPVDIRVFAATNADLTALVGRKLFREDLFYRLNVASLRLPPLRDRGEDIAPLAKYFLDRYARKLRKNVRELDEEALRCLQSYRFPGNVRELENIIERSVIAAENEMIARSDMELRGDGEPEEDLGFSENDERDVIRKTIAENKYNLRRAAEFLGISRATLYRKLHHYGLEPR